MSSTLKDTFEMDSVIKTLVLCVITLGSYLLYKLYQFSNQINDYSSDKNAALKISNRFMITTTVLFFLSLVSLVYGLINLDNPDILRSSIALHFISSIFDVSWIVMVRNRINLISGAVKGDPLWLNPFITAIFHVIYMQHKINQAISKVDYKAQQKISQ